MTPARPRKIARRGSRLVFVLEDTRWRAPGLRPLMRRAVRRALGEGGQDAAALTLLLTGAEKLRELNKTFRGKNRATDVLSFPGDGKSDYLGDIAIAYDVALADARAQGKTMADHAAHLAVHGVLHLLGHDHAEAGAAEAMERLEARILAPLGISDPYAVSSARAA